MTATPTAPVPEPLQLRPDYPWRSETERILAIRVLEGGAPDLTPHFRRPGGTRALWPIQSQALWEAGISKGLCAPIGVGHGKTLICQLIPRLFPQLHTVVQLLPANLVNSYYSERLINDKHFYVSTNVQLFSYSKLSRPNGTELLERIKPDIIICDEVHYLRHASSARTKRLLRYLEAHPETLFFGLSGTMTTRSVKDYEHLSRFALGYGSPVPSDEHTLGAWSNVIDANAQPSNSDMEQMRPFFLQATGHQAPMTRENVRRVFRRRFRTAPGVVASEEGSIGASLLIEPRRIPIPPEVKDVMDEFQQTWCLGDEEYGDPMSFGRKMRELSQGFYYIWDWPNGVIDVQWMEARKRWHRACRQTLENHAQAGFDSPMLIGLACERGQVPQHSEVFQAWFNWQQFKDRPAPPTKPVWLSPYLVYDALAWAKHQKSPVVLWYQSQAMEQVLQYLGVPTYGAGVEPPMDRAHLCAMSIRAHGVGKNLQAWKNQLVLDPPSNGKDWEQLLGRMHRAGQEADEVLCTYYAHTGVYNNSMRQARTDAAYIEQTTGTKQKLVYATYVGEEEDS